MPWIRSLLAVCLVAPERAWLEQRVGPEEVADRELELVVGVIGLAPGRIIEVHQVIAALLEDHNGPSGGGEDVGDGAAARPGPHDDCVNRRSYGWLTSSSV